MEREQERALWQEALAMDTNALRGKIENTRARIAKLDEKIERLYTEDETEETRMRVFHANTQRIQLKLRGRLLEDAWYKRVGCHY